MSYTIGIDARKLHDFGIGTYVRNLIHALAELDRENRYVVFYRTPAAGTPLADLPENFQVVAERSPVYSLREMVALSWRLFRLKLDLYHATHYVLPAVVPCRVVVTIHDIIHLLYPEFLPSRLAFFYAQRMIRRSLTRGDRIITVSQNTKADLMEYFEVDGTKIDVVYNGVDDVFRRHLRPDELERALKSLEIPRPYLLFVGNPAKKHKNLDNVVKAYARARQIHPFDAPLVCVGDRTSAGFKFLQRAAQLGIGDRVLLLGHVAAGGAAGDLPGGEPLPLPHPLRGLRPAGGRGDGLGGAGDHLQHLVAQGDRRGLLPPRRPAQRRGDGQGHRPVHGRRGPPQGAGQARPAARPGLPLAAHRRAHPGDLPERHRGTAPGPDSADGSGGSAAAPRTTGAVAVGGAGCGRERRRGRRVTGRFGARPALVHDWLTGMRGGEKVLAAIASLLPGAPIHTLFHFPGSVSGALESHPVHTSFLQRAPGTRRHYRRYLPLFPAAVEGFDLAGHDLVISSSHCVAKGAIPPPGSLHVCYCHTPMRYAWDQEHAYFPRRDGVKARLRGLVLSRLRTWDVASAARVDAFVANSRFVAERIRRYYRREAEVIHPPVDVEFFTPSPPAGEPRRPGGHGGRRLLPDGHRAGPLQADRAGDRRLRAARPRAAGGGHRPRGASACGASPAPAPGSSAGCRTRSCAGSTAAPAACSSPGSRTSASPRSRPWPAARRWSPSAVEACSTWSRTASTGCSSARPGRGTSTRWRRRLTKPAGSASMTLNLRSRAEAFSVPRFLDRFSTFLETRVSARKERSG